MGWCRLTYLCISVIEIGFSVAVLLPLLQLGAPDWGLLSFFCSSATSQGLPLLHTQCNWHHVEPGSQGLFSLCREFKYKTNITFHDNDTVSYLEYRQLFFRPDLSNGTEDEYIVMPNILMLVRACFPETCWLAGRVVMLCVNLKLLFLSELNSIKLQD